MSRPKLSILIAGAVVLMLSIVLFRQQIITPAVSDDTEDTSQIKWVSFDIPVEALQKAGQADIDSYQSDYPINWIETLAYLACQYGGNWKQYDADDLTQLIELQQQGQQIQLLALNKQSRYHYYLKIYNAVLAEFIGEYQIEEIDDNDVSTIVHDYGVKVFSPIAGGYGYSHYDDFGAGRSYGYTRKHQGNDLHGSLGTPIMAVEGGTIEEMSWNQYGGWRIGIRSFDQKRYYYYAHLRSGHPFVYRLSKGDTVKAGDVIGYMGMTGYSTVPDTNKMKKPHLHFGLQLIFDDRNQQDQNELWIDVYELIKFLSKHRSHVELDPQKIDYQRKAQFEDLSNQTQDE